MEAAPWTGGFFERLVQSVKRCLRKLLRKSRLTYEEMLTLLVKIENIINNRPITYVYDEVSQPLTPNHLIFGRKLETNVPITDDNEEYVPLEFETIERNLTYFWEQWKNEYVTSLREQHLGNQKKSDSGILVGDLAYL